MFLSLLIELIFTVYCNFYGKILAELLPVFYCINTRLFFTVYVGLNPGSKQTNRKSDRFKLLEKLIGRFCYTSSTTYTDRSCADVINHCVVLSRPFVIRQ